MSAVALAAAFVGAHVAAAAAGGTWWGLHHLRYLGAPQIALVALGASIAAALFAWPERVPRVAVSAPGLALLAVASVALFWTLRDRSHLLGDGSVILESAADAPAWSDKEPLAQLLDFPLHRAARRFDVPPARVFELFSALLGAALVVLLARADRAAAAQGWLFLLVLTTGAAQLFFGYVEHYPALAVAVVACLLALRRPVEQRASLLPALLCFWAALFLHISSIVLVPAIAWAGLQQTRRRESRERPALWGDLVLSTAAAWFAWRFAFQYVPGASSFEQYLAVLGQARRFTAATPGAATSAVGPALLSAAHLRDFANLQLLLVPVALPLAILATLATGTRRFLAQPFLAQPWPATLALASGGYLAAQVAFSPYLGAPRDWDVLAAGAFPIAMLAASLVPSLATPPSRRTRALVAGLATFHALAWVAVNASPAAALARFAELPLPEGQVDFVLGTRALKSGDLREATSRFERVVRDVPTSCPGWFSLGLAREGQRDAARARDAFAHALAAFERDRRVPKGEILERLGRADWETGRADEAAKAFELAHAERPASLPPVIFLAVRAAREGRPDEVLRWLEPVMERKAEQPAILMLAADALDALGRSDEANERRREAARVFPNDPAVRAALERRPTEERR